MPGMLQQRVHQQQQKKATRETTIAKMREDWFECVAYTSVGMVVGCCITTTMLPLLPCWGTYVVMIPKKKSPAYCHIINKFVMFDVQFQSVIV